MSVARHVEKLRRDFLWGGLRDEFKYHLVKWKTFCMPVQYGDGGLGVHNLVLFNKPLLEKWFWRYAMERNDLWRRQIDAKYGRCGGLVFF